MIRQDLGGVFVAVISAGRSANVPEMEQLVGGATWYVRDEDLDDYSSMQASGVAVVGGVLCHARNLALKDAFALGLPCLQLSDDLRKLKRAAVVDNGDRVVAVPVPFADAVGMMMQAMLQTKAFLAGVAPTSNAFYYNPERPVHTRAFIVGDMILVKPCELRFDETMPLKEDYDYTLQHLKEYGRVARCDSVLAEFTHRTNAGGACAYRTVEKEQEAISILKNKWGSVIADNAKRPNEILLKLPRVK